MLRTYNCIDILSNNCKFEVFKLKFLDLYSNRAKAGMLVDVEKVKREFVKPSAAC